MADAEQARIAQELYERLGRADNILQATNCMTRLRVRLVRKDAALVAAVKGVKGVIGALDVGDEFQIVLGPGRVQAVADEVRSFMAADRAAAKKKSGANVEVEPWSVAACVAWYAALALLLFLLRSRLSRRRRTI